MNFSKAVRCSGQLVGLVNAVLEIGSLKQKRC